MSFSIFKSPSKSRIFICYYGSICHTFRLSLSFRLSLVFTAAYCRNSSYTRTKYTGLLEPSMLKSKTSGYSAKVLYLRGSILSLHGNSRFSWGCICKLWTSNPLNKNRDGTLSSLANCSSWQFCKDGDGNVINAAKFFLTSSSELSSVGLGLSVSR